MNPDPTQPMKTTRHAHGQHGGRMGTWLFLDQVSPTVVVYAMVMNYIASKLGDFLL